MLREGSACGIIGSFASPEKKFARVCIITLIIVIYLLMKRKSLSLKLTIKMLTFQLNFVLEIYLMDLVLLSLQKYLKGNEYDSSVDFNFIDKSDILNIHKYLMIKSNVKIMFSHIK